MAHMYPPPHMTHMYPPPHMTHMYPPPQHSPNLVGVANSTKKVLVVNPQISAPWSSVARTCTIASVCVCVCVCV